MKLPHIKTIGAAALILALATSLSGCIVYVSPDKTHIHHVGVHETAPAPDEKPADTVDKTPA